MIHLRASFVLACGLTGLMLLLLVACDLGAAPAQPSPSAVAVTTVPSSSPAAIISPSPSALAEAPSPSAPPDVPQGGAVAMHIADDITELKPWDLRSRAEEYAAELMYNGLTQLDADLIPQPDLAREWTVSPDGGLITFTLHSDVIWHDGEPLTADDVVWTLNTLRTITPTNSLLFDLRTTIGEVRAPLTSTVVVSLTQPYAPLLAELAVPILPKHRLQGRTPEQIAALNFWDVPVGSGPFKFDKRAPGQSISFVRNDSYFDGAPHLDQIALVVAPDPAVAAEALRDGQLQVAEFAANTAAISPTVDTLNVGSYPENGWYGLVFNQRSDRLFADGRLRSALALAVDVDALVQTATNGRGQPIVSTLSQASALYPPDLAVPARDLDAARRLLDEAGWVPGSDGVRQNNGRPLAARIWVRGDDPRRVAAAQGIAAAAAEVGMQLEVAPANFDTVILAKLAPPYDFDLLLGSWVNAPNSAGFPTSRFLDPDDWALFHSSRVWRGQGDARTGLRNVGGFSSEAYDSAADAARRRYEPEARAAAIREAQAVLAREQPYLLLWTDQITVGLSKRLNSAAAPIDPSSPRFLWKVEEWYLDTDSGM